MAEEDAETLLKPLMLAALAGDAAAYRQLLSAAAPRLRAYFLRRLGQSADAEDLVQETLIAIHTKRASYDPALPFTAWLHAIARYKLIDHWRRSGVRRTLPLEAAETVVAEQTVETTEAARDVEHLLAKLPEAKRDLVRRVKLEGQSIAEAAAATGQSESAVKVGLHRTLKALAKLAGRGEPE